jgi:transketolase
LVIRPCDANGTAAAWQIALETHGRPAALILSRQNLPTLDRSRCAPAEGARRGAYVLADAEGGVPDLLLLASGSEVSLAAAAQRKLSERNVRARVVSMPSWELFDEQPQGYRDEVLPPRLGKRLAVEAGTPLGWHRYIGSEGGIIGVERFGASAPGEVVLREYGFTVENVCRRALELLGLGEEE